MVYKLLNSSSINSWADIIMDENSLFIFRPKFEIDIFLAKKNKEKIKDDFFIFWINIFCQASSKMYFGEHIL